MEESEEETIRKAMALLGSRKTEKKTAASRESIVRATAARTGKPMTEEHRANLAEAQRARREREKQAKGTGEARKEQAEHGKS